MNSDIWALLVDRVVVVTPLSLDLTARVDWNSLDPWLRGEPTAREDMLGLAAFFNCPPLAPHPLLADSLHHLPACMSARRQAEAKRRAVTGRAFGPDASAVTFDDVARNRQP